MVCLTGAFPPRNWTMGKNWQPSRTKIQQNDLLEPQPMRLVLGILQELWFALDWGARIRTQEWRDQNPLPYRLATPHRLRCK